MLRPLEGRPGYFYEEVPLPGLDDRHAVVLVHDVRLRTADQSDDVSADWALLLPAISEGRDVKLDPRLRFADRVALAGSGMGMFWGAAIELPELPGRWRQGSGRVYRTTYRLAVADAYGIVESDLNRLRDALLAREASLAKAGSLEELTDLIDFGGAGAGMLTKARRLIEPVLGRESVPDDDDMPF